MLTMAYVSAAACSCGMRDVIGRQSVCTRMRRSPRLLVYSSAAWKLAVPPSAIVSS